MRDLIEYTCYVGGAILIWGKIGSIALGLGLILYGCYRFNKALNRIRFIRSDDLCQ